MPGEAAAKVVQTKEPSHKDDFGEWLARIICYAFSVPPQWAVKLMNRATADNQSAQAEDEGLVPTKEWVKDLIDEIIAEEFASPDLELAWLSEDENDASKAEAALEARVKIGAVTLNELRGGLGLDPYTNPAADRPMVLTATGYVPIEANVGASANPLPDAGAKGEPLEVAPSIYQKAAPDDSEHPGWPAGTPGGVGGQFRPKDESGVGSSNQSEDDSELDGASRPVEYAARETGTQTDESRGSAGAQYASTAPPDVSRVLTGNSRTDEVTKKLAQIYADTIDTLERLPGQPQRYGTIVHLAFAAAVIAAGIPEPMDIERAFALPPGFSNWKKTVRPDIVLRDDGGDVVAIYDIKTGDKGISRCGYQVPIQGATLLLGYPTKKQALSTMFTISASWRMHIEMYASSVNGGMPLRSPGHRISPKK